LIHEFVPGVAVHRQFGCVVTVADPVPPDALNAGACTAENVHAALSGPGEVGAVGEVV
jgi:hypothetical protein